MTYRQEFRSGWPALLAAFVGIALGAALSAYTTSLFAPALLAEFGWSKAQFALTGTLGLASMALVPVAGRFVDRVGARAAALTGYLFVPTAFLAMSLMTGPIWQYFAIALMQQVFGILTTTIVFARVVIERFDAARGIGLSLLMTGPPLAGAIAGPLLGDIIDTDGWRAGYRALALVSALGGAAALAMLGRGARKAGAARPARTPLTLAQLKAMLRQRVFLLLVAGMFLCNLPQVIVMSQLKLVLLESGSPAGLATWIVSLYATGVIVGRFAAGLALDRVPAHVVALFTLGLPTLGYVALASPLTAPTLLAGAVLLIGLAQGSEGDVAAYLASRRFDMQHFSLLYGLVVASMGLASAIGSGLLSLSLARTGSFDAFLLFSAVVTVAGALAFYATGTRQEPAP